MLRGLKCVLNMGLISLNINAGTAVPLLFSFALEPRIFVIHATMIFNASLIFQKVNYLIVQPVSNFFLNFFIIIFGVIECYFFAGPKAKQLEGDECPLHVTHPPTGEEFALGCGVCRNAHTF